MFNSNFPLNSKKSIISNYSREKFQSITSPHGYNYNGGFVANGGVIRSNLSSINGFISINNNNRISSANDLIFKEFNLQK